MYNDIHFFILVYNRTDKIPTLNVLSLHNVHDNIHLVVGKDDPCILDVFNNFNDYDIIVFDKQDYVEFVDSIGSYKQTLKLCTYARVAVDMYAESNNISYICLLFDDIQSIQLRYIVNNKVCSSKQFNLLDVVNAYIELLNCNDSIYMVGPPGSSWYIGCKPESMVKVPTHYANMLIYDIHKSIGPYRASVLEDMDIVLSNSSVGHIGLFPMGVQVNCRQARFTKDAYTGITESEYLQQYSIITRTCVDSNKVKIPYKNFIPKIISDKYKK